MPVIGRPRAAALTQSSAIVSQPAGRALSAGPSGAERGSVTDIYLPKWLAHSITAIHTPLLVLMAYLHARNLRRTHHTQAAKRTAAADLETPSRQS